MSPLWSGSISMEDGPCKVLIKRGVFVDDTRTNDDGSVREIPYKIYYPSAEGLSACPVIVWSHGYGGSADGAGFLARYLVSYGYVLVHVTHVGTDSSLWEGKPGHPWDILRDHKVTRKASLNRYKDISFVVDTLAAWGRDNPEVGKLMDLTRLGISGHSFGAITTQVAAGQLIPDEGGALVSLKEPRFKAAIAYSPVPGTAHLSGDDEEDAVEIYASISVPMLHMTGTEDSAPIGGEPYTGRFVVYEQTPDGVPKALLVKEGGDHMVYNGTRGQLAANPNRERHEDIVKVLSLAWWEAWLRGDQSAMAWLRDGGVQAYLEEDAEWKAVL